MGRQHAKGGRADGQAAMRAAQELCCQVVGPVLIASGVPAVFLIFFSKLFPLQIRGIVAAKLAAKAAAATAADSAARWSEKEIQKQAGTIKKTS